ncbi:MAG: HD domain-containing protein [Desulfobulbaceae bacterium]|nr:HD domain-containing protein [Desulfobulbaceae bacterium]
MLLGIKKELDGAEQRKLSATAVLSRDGVRRIPENQDDHRQNFAQDADRIIHSRAYTRYIDKTQVFSLIENDHITHRVLHVQLVSRIARTIGRYLGLNEDLLEAIALGHDIGHPPFGHEGERILDELCLRFGSTSFHHNIQSVQFLDKVEKKGKGWNLTLQVLDGIFCHDGETHSAGLRPKRGKTFMELDSEIAHKIRNLPRPVIPMSLEGCVVRLADTIGYIGRDIEDAVELKLVERDEIPKVCAKRLGNSNGSIVYSLVTDLIENSLAVREVQVGDEDDRIGFSDEVGELLLELKRFNYERIYMNPAFKPDFIRIHHCYENLFSYYLEMIAQEKSGGMGAGLLLGMSENYRLHHNDVAIVRDYLAGMTDDYFLRLAEERGCVIPVRKCLPN